MQEYLTIATFLALIFVCGVFSVFAGNDLIIFAATAGLMLFALLFLGKIDPVHLLYALGLGASFLPYINLEMFPLSGVYVMAFIFVLISLIHLFKQGRKIIFSAQAKWLLLFLAIGILYIAIAQDKRSSIIYCGQFFLYICVYMATVNVLNKKPKIVRALRYIIYGSIVTLLVSMMQLVVSLDSLQQVVDIFYTSIIGELFIGARGLERLGDSAAIILNRGSNISEASELVIFRVFGTFEGPTVFGSYLLLIGVVITGLYFVQIKKRRVGFSKYFSATLFVLIMGCLVLTWTRSAILAFIMASGFIFLYRYQKSVQLFSAKNIKVIFLVIVIPIGVLFFVSDIFSLRTIGGSTAGRLLTIIFALSYIYQNPIIGTGLGNYRYVQPGVSADSSEASFASAHNTYLELGVEVGLPGLLIFLLILRSFIKQAAKLIKAPVNTFYHTLGIIFVAMWIGFVLVSIFGGGLIHPRYMTILWLLAGVQTASYHLYLNDKRKENTVYCIQVAD
jgi:hypothetical protein